METDAYKTPLSTRISQKPPSSTSTRERLKCSTRFWRVIILIASLAIYGTYHHAYAMPSTDNDLSPYTDSIFLPFTRPFNTKHVPQVMCTVEGVNINMPVDTGS